MNGRVVGMRLAVGFGAALQPRDGGVAMATFEPFVGQDPLSAKKVAQAHIIVHTMSGALVLVLDDEQKRTFDALYADAIAEAHKRLAADVAAAAKVVRLEINNDKPEGPPDAA